MLFRNVLGNGPVNERWQSFGHCISIRLESTSVYIWKYHNVMAARCFLVWIFIHLKEQIERRWYDKLVL